MATSTRKKTAQKRPIGRQIRRVLLLGFAGFLSLIILVTLLYKVTNPPTTPYMFAEGRRQGESVEQVWLPLDEMGMLIARSVVAAEDANFCLHWGLDVGAIRAALDAGGNRGASTISQQVVKNVYLWHGRSWPRKVAEALWTPLTEALWSKARILEIYLNVAEVGPGVFGVEAAAQRYFGVAAEDLTPNQAARIAVVFPSPKTRDPAALSAALRQRANSIEDGAATIAADGRAACFGG
jgi:monofunctional biosynthetic peptidoglycan transglycosylase